MGIRDRIAGLGRRAALQLAGALASAASRSASGNVAASAAAASQAQGAKAATADPTENFGASAIGFDAASLTRAMRDAVWGGEFTGGGSAGGGFGRDGQGLEALAMAKARAAASGGNLAEGAEGLGIGPAVDDPKAIYWDPFALVQQLGFRERPSAITYGTLDSMVWRVPIVQAILQTRINQVSSFATPQHYKFETGFRIRMRDPEAKPTPADKKFIRSMERTILNCGVEVPGQGRRDSFETFLRKIVRDSLTYDQACWEIVPGRDGRPAEWYAVDAATIRLADTARLYPDDDPDRVSTVQIYDNVMVAEFTSREMAFMVRNPRTNIRSYGYGTSELEMVVSTVTAILWAWHYNQNFFSQGSVAKGLLNLVGSIPEKQLRAFRRQWYQMVSGVENAWRTPITNAEKVEWINMHASNRDMEFSAWMDFLIKVVAACYVMDPVEINFKYGTQAQRCYAPETALLLFDGAVKRADAVAVGDQLMGPDSTPRNVTKTCAGRAEMYEIVPSRGAPWRCTGNHELTLINSATNNVIDIRVVDYLDKPRRFRQEYRLFQPDGVEFPARAAPTLDPYFYGLWVGDGSKDHSQGVVVTTMDDEIVSALQETADAWNLSLRVCSETGRAKGYRLTGTPGSRAPNPVRAQLDALWSDGQIDASIKLGSWETRRQFLAGFLDTDGHLAAHGYFTFVQKNEKTFNDVVFIARSLGYKVTSHRERSTWYHRETREKRTSVNSCAIVSGPVYAIPTRLPRKRAQENHLPRFDPRRTGFTVRRVEDGAFAGFETDGDHRHLLADFTVSHNSMFEGAQRAKSQESRERGLKPLLRAIGRELDRTIIWPINNEFSLEFVGLESQTPKELADLMTQRVRTLYTVDELRAENDMPPIPDGLGEIILDANWMNARNLLLQQKQAEVQQKQQMQMQAHAAASNSPNELEALLGQLQGKPPKMPPTGGAPGGGPGAPSAPKGSTSNKEQQTLGGGKPTSIPAQTSKQISNELGGVGTSGAMELSRRPAHVVKSSAPTGPTIIEVDL